VSGREGKVLRAGRPGKEVTMKYISRIRMSIITDEVNRVLYSVNLESVATFEEDMTNKIVMGVNWSCLGAQKSDDALKFAEDITFVSKIADFINRYEFIEAWDDPVLIDRDEVRELRKKISGYAVKRDFASISNFINESYFTEEDK